jgi:multidrug efflux pump
MSEHQEPLTTPSHHDEASLKPRFTDIFIQRPVLATVVSLLIFLVGLVSMTSMPLQQYPTMSNTTITVSIAYPGASAQVVQGFITTPMEASIASANGIDYLTSQSTVGQSIITAYIRLNYDPEAALTDITGDVNAVLNQMPQGSLSPTITKQTDQSIPNLILGFTSDEMTSEQISAYVNNVFVPKVNALGGISNVVLYGYQPYSMRIWLNSYKMAKLGITPTDVSNALNQNHVLATAGQLKSEYLYIPVQANTDLHTEAEFNNLVIKNDHGNIIRISDVGRAELGSQTYDTRVFFNNKTAVFAGIQTAVNANPLTVIDTVIKNLPEIERSFPPGLKVDIVYNNTLYIKASIREVIKTICEAALIVVFIIFLFLGTIRSVFIPVITMPLSLVGSGFLMLLMGFSINLLTLLAMVLAIGLVVDDAIVVLENIYRHLEEGLDAKEAALRGAREIANPVIVMTTTLVAVYAPIGFLGGITGALFKEFAFTLAGSVLISGVIALTFSPMLCSKMINRETLQKPFTKKIDRVFEGMKNFYKKKLLQVLVYRSIGLLVASVVLASCVIFFMVTPKELAPQEDQGFIGVQGQGPTPVNLNYVARFNKQTNDIMASFPEAASTFIVDGYPLDNNMFAGVNLKLWDQRKKTEMQINPLLQNKLAAVTGMQLFSFELPPLPGTQGLPIQFVVNSTASHQDIFPYTQELIKKAYQSGLFIFMQSDLRFDQPQLLVNIDRDKAAQLGVNMSDIATALGTMMSDAYTNFFSMGGYSYQVIPQVDDLLRERSQQLNQFYVKSQTTGEVLPLSTFVSYGSAIQPSTLNQFQQLNSVTLTGQMMPGVTMGTALNFLTTTAQQILPKEMSIDYAQASRQFIQEGNSMIFAFMFAIIIIFLVLAAQFESFRDPFIVLISVPMSICGALIPLFLGAATINIYTEIGLITLIGLISKHGILMVEFANKLQEQQKVSPHDAIVEAASIRLRPILMTTFAMVFGVIPLILAAGAGAKSRFDVGLVIASGMAIGTCFTLFMVPIMYTYIAKRHIAIALQDANPA